MSNRTFALIVAPTTQPAWMFNATVPSCARVTVNTSPTTLVTRTISAFDTSNNVLGGPTVTLNGAGSNHVPSPA